MSNQPVAMVVFASEQLWPNIQGLVYWHERCGGVSDLCIYQTKDARRSVAPAGRLAWLCNRLYPKVQVRLSRTPDQAGQAGAIGDPLIQPAAVREQLRAWRAELPDRRLVVNATGGLKLMFAGVLDCLHLPDTEVVYRELGENEWYRVTRNTQGVETERLTVPRNITDHLDLKTLLSCHWQPAEGKWTAERPSPLPIARLVQEGRAHNWDWKHTFSACGLNSVGQPGQLFEQFVAASLLALGVKQVALNCKLQAGPQVLLEVDVVANYGGRILIVDCKLRSGNDKRVEGLTSQIRQAAEIRRRMGGLAAELLMLRPGMAFSEEERQLADSHGLKVLDAKQTLQFFNRLWSFVRGTGPLPPEAAEAQACLDFAAAQGDREALASSMRLGPLACPEPVKVLLDLDVALRDVLSVLDQNWVVYKIHGSYRIYVRPMKVPSEQQIKERIENLFQRTAVVQSVIKSKTGNTFWASLTIPDRTLEQFRELLIQLAGTRLFQGPGGRS